MSFDWAAFFEYLPRLVAAAGVTLQISVLSLGLACLLAPVLALVRLLCYLKNTRHQPGKKLKN